VNGRQVSSGEDWNRLESVPLHNTLKEGTNVIVIVARNAGKGTNAAGAFFEARLRSAEGVETVLITDATWESHTVVPVGKEGRLGALPAKGWKPVTLVKPVPGWTQVVARNGPPLLAQASLASLRPVRASLMKSDFLMRTLGRPNRDQIVSMRPDDLTTLEAIDLSNGSILTDTLARGARNLLAKKQWPDMPAFVQWLYLSALSREPNADEVAEMTSALGKDLKEQGIADALWSVVMLPEFQRVR
jgi:hypothetical protein